MKDEWTIEELSSETGIARRTIHFYVQQGLLPPPAGAGLGARYTREHVLRLKAVPVLRQTGLRLDDIRERFARASQQELEALTAEAPDSSRTGAVQPVASAPLYRVAESPPEWELQSPGSDSALMGEEYQYFRLSGGAVLLVPGSTARRLSSRLEPLLEYINSFFRRLD